MPSEYIFNTEVSSEAGSPRRRMLVHTVGNDGMASIFARLEPDAPATIFSLKTAVALNLRINRDNPGKLDLGRSSEEWLEGFWTHSPLLIVDLHGVSLRWVPEVFVADVPESVLGRKGFFENFGWSYFKDAVLLSPLPSFEGTISQIRSAAEEKSSGNKLSIEVQVPEGLSETAAIEWLKTLYERMNEFHRSHGGSGLTVSSFEAFDAIPEGVRK